MKMKYLKGLQNQKAYTFMEVLIAIALSIILTGALIAAFLMAQQTCAKVSAEQNLQQIANVIMRKIIKGSPKSGGLHRLNQAISFDFNNTYTANVSGELNFQGTDGVNRSFYINTAGTSILYHDPGVGGADEVIYTAPPGMALVLQFWPGSLEGAVYSGVDVGINVGLIQSIKGQTVSGSLQTFVNIRNHSA